MSRTQEGVALVAVLSLLALLSVLAFGVLEAARRHGHLARRSFDTLQARETADSALRLAILQLGAPASPFTSVPTSHSVEVFGKGITVSIQLEEGRIDLNTTEAPLLTAAFAGNGIPESQARELANRILDWRDVDDEPREGGAERSEYLRLRRNGAPRNGPFESVAELRRVVGFETIDPRVLDAFTVYSHTAAPSELLAVPVVLQALRWAHEHQLEGRGWLSEEPLQASALGETFSLSGRAARLHACTRVSESSVCREAIVRFTGDVNRPAMIYSWSSTYVEETELHNT